MQSYRVDRLGKEIRKILSESISFLGREIGGGLVSVTSVKVTKDLSLAKVYISSIGTKATPLEIIEYLNANKSVYRNDIAKKMKIRIIPDLKFFLDETLDEIDHIQNLMNSIKSKE